MRPESLAEIQCVAQLWLLMDTKLRQVGKRIFRKSLSWKLFEGRGK